MSAHAVPEHFLVVGGSQGLGSTVVRLLAAAGHLVSILDLQAPAGGPAGPTVEHRAVDLLDAAGVAAALDLLHERRGAVRHALFLQRFRGGGADAWEREIAISLDATRRVVERCAPRFPADGGSIVLVSSAAGSFVAEEQPLGYHAAKGALEAMTRYWAVALGPRGVRCNAVAPAIFRKDGYPPDSPRDRALAPVIPLRRVPTAEEIARVVLFLAGPASACVTGQTIAVDGGLSLLAHATLVQRLAGPAPGEPAR